MYGSTYREKACGADSGVLASSATSCASLVFQWLLGVGLFILHSTFNAPPSTAATENQRLLVHTKYSFSPTLCIAVSRAFPSRWSSQRGYTVLLSASAKHGEIAPSALRFGALELLRDVNNERDPAAVHRQSVHIKHSQGHHPVAPGFELLLATSRQ
jgi:hypothetical protein